MVEKKTKNLLIGLALMAAAAASAQGAAPPAPSKEMAQLKAYQGSWVCQGNVPAGPLGPARKTSTTLKFGSDLDNMWMSGRIAEAPSKDNAHPFKGVAYMAYDAGAKSYVMLVVDNTGGRSMQTSPGWEADKMVWLGDGSMDGKKIGVRDTFTRKGADLQHLGELQLDGKWMVVQDEVCRPASAKK